MTPADRDDRDDSNDVWLFGYGSLIWRPEVAFSERAPAFLDGYQRRFWQRSTDHRGTLAHPGRVVTLIPAPAMRTLGVAYRLLDPRTSLERVDIREQQGYERRLLPISIPRSTGVHPRCAVVYVADSAALRNPYFASDEPLDRTAAVIASALGPSGSNLEYACALLAAIEQLSLEVGVDPEDHCRYEREVVARAQAYSVR